MIVFDVLVDARGPGRHDRRMPSFSDLERAAPELAAAVRARLDAHVHKTLATVRRDGAPRISGTETRWHGDDLWIGSMWQARKALDLQRDPRFALHSGSDDPPGWKGDAKVAGVVEEVLDPALIAEINGEAAKNGPTHLFRLDVREVSTVELNAAGDQVIITSWTPAAGVRTLERA